MISINFKEQFLILPPKVSNFNPSPQITLKLVLTYQIFKSTSHLWRNTFQDHKYITTIYIANVIYVSLVKSLERVYVCLCFMFMLSCFNVS